LARIKGVGEETARLIVSKRNGRWKSLAEFIKNVKVNKKVLEALIKAGAFDFTGMSRTEMLSKLSEKDSLYSTRGLFQAGQKVQEDYSKYEREVLGFYLSQHPLDPYEKLLNGKVVPLEGLEDLEEGEYTFAGVISDLKIKKNSKGSLYAVFNLIDKTGIGEVVLWSEIYEENKERLKEDELVVVRGTLVEDQETESLKIVAKEIYSVEDFLSSKIKYVRIKIQRELTDKELESLHRAVIQCLSEKGAELLIECRLNGKSVLMQADPRYRLEPKAELYNLLRDLPVEVSLEL
jgi:DNA polymerase III, alpha subunit